MQRVFRGVSIKEKFYRPTFVLSDGEGCVKGSGRSIEGYSMFEKMNECKDLLLKFGGHPMAAGLSMAKENIDAFRRRMNENANLTGTDLVPKVRIDVPMPLSYISERLVHQLDLLEPFGNANEKPSFAQAKVPVKSISRIGKEGQYAKLLLETDARQTMEGLFFGDADQLENDLKEKDTLSILYYPQINEFRGRTSLQVVIKDYLVN